jgi:2-succinyl-5-enolpyruvyl-6-hydroxy-3-cyclohexene-1-carboxylate synthase
MTGSAANTVWARSFVDELVRAGVREVVLAPGSRSTPLVMACAADERITMRVHLDERSASFFALGIGKASGRPAAMITTSGTAVANAFPAVVEASQAGVPLLVLTADRPHRLRGADANQAIDQVGIYGAYVRAFFELAPPTTDARAIGHLRALAARAVAASVGPSSGGAGPVHVNFPFDKPLDPVETLDGVLETDAVAVSGRPSGESFTQITLGRTVLSDVQLAEVADVVARDSGVLVVGPSEDADRVGLAALRYAASTGLPVLADPLSGARYGPSHGALVVAGYDLFLRDPAVRARFEPGVIMRVGASPTSAALQRWLFEHDHVPQIVLDGGGRWKDHGVTATHYLNADPVDTLNRLTALRGTASREVLPPDAPRRGTPTEWSVAWLVADRAVRDITEPYDTTTPSDITEPSDITGPSDIAGPSDIDRPHEGDVVAAAIRTIPDGGSLFVSNSMPIRDLDAFAHPSDARVHVFANRGASGIDGVVSTAFGVASQSQGSTLCVIGDVAFFHDQNGLLWSREADAPVVFVVIDNDGGGIFRLLPIAEYDPHFTRFFTTPHGIHPRHASEAHGIHFVDLDLTGPNSAGIARIESAIRDALASGRTTVIRVGTDREVGHDRRAAAHEAVARSVREALG